MHRYRWDLIGLVAGVATAFVDLYCLRLLGVTLTFGAHDATVAVGSVFALTMGALGFLAGRLYLDREALRRARDRAAEAEKLAAIGRLAAGVAHEVRNPLGVIRASASVVAEAARDSGDPDAARAARFVVEEADRLDHLVEALLRYARPTRPETVPVSVAELLDEAGLRARQTIGDDVAVSVMPGDGRVAADRDLVVNALVGLVVNAAEAGAETVELRARDGGLEVADSGPGLDDEVARHLFEPFVSTKPGGTGLGLATLARVAGAHGGALAHVAGRGLGPDGRGACFRLELPVA